MSALKTHLAVAAMAMCQIHGIEARPAEKHRKGERIRGLKPCGPIVSGLPLIKRNKPCPCGSDKKFKACCLGRVAT